MNTDPSTRRLRGYLIFCIILLVLAGTVQADPATTVTQANPVTYLDFNEGSGILALDASGHGNAGTIAGATRTDIGGCGGALLFNGTGEYVSIPYTTQNHPTDAITVSTWFYVDSFGSQTLVSSYKDGGYRLGFGDGNDLWWTVYTEQSGIISVPVQHEGITPRQWHHVTGTYDGETAKIYLDGALRNRLNASGQILYEYPNYVILGADAGTATTPDSSECPRYLNGGLDEVRIYDTALEYSQVMDDRFRCSAEPKTLLPEPANVTAAFPACTASSGTVHLNTGESAYRTLLFTDKLENETWYVSVPAGSELIVKGRDLFSSSYPDAWYIEIADGTQRVDRSIAFPNTNNAPVKGVIPSGNATVYVRYFDGKYRFPASVEIEFQCLAQPPLPPVVIPKNILANPGIVIYSASWATLIAVLVVVIWLHRRKTKARESRQNEGPETDTDTGEPKE
ncbi:MAG: LamG domain-containing protein [Methanoregula sp.]|nr:LamG domain-containing protein [Methanoregula sp.]